MAAHLLRPRPERGLVQLARVGLANDRTELMANAKGFGLRQSLDVPL
jgi:hypothetical protein